MTFFHHIASKSDNFLSIPDSLDPCNEEFEFDDLLNSNFDDVLDLIVIPELEHEKQYNHSHLAKDIQALRHRIDQLFHANNKQDYEKLVLLWSYGNGGKVFEGLVIDGVVVTVDPDCDFSVPANDCEAVEVCETITIPRLGQKYVCKTHLSCKTSLDLNNGNSSEESDSDFGEANDDEEFSLGEEYSLSEIYELDLNSSL